MQKNHPLLNRTKKFAFGIYREDWTLVSLIHFFDCWISLSSLLFPNLFFNLVKEINFFLSLPHFQHFFPFNSCVGRKKTDFGNFFSFSSCCSLLIIRFISVYLWANEDNAICLYLPRKQTWNLLLDENLADVRKISHECVGFNMIMMKKFVFHLSKQIVFII